MTWTSQANRCCIFLIGLLVAMPLALAQPVSSKWNALSQRERTFLQFVFNGDAAKAQEYAQAASINPNAIGGEPLAVWFYRVGALDWGQLYDINAQRIVFETFRQNPNPQNIGETNLKKFCNHAPYPRELLIRSTTLSTSGQARGPQWQAVMQEIAEKQKPHVETMADRFSSLVRYGLRDKAIVREIFAACMGQRPFTLTPELYDRLITPMLRAGADLNQPLEDGRRPVEMFVRAIDAPMVARVVRDGAQLNVTVKGGACRESTNLYVYLMNDLKPVDPEPALEIIKILSAAGLSPLKPVAYGGYQCRHGSLYDAVLDTGNISYAQAIKAAAESPPSIKQAAPVASLGEPVKETSAQSRPTQIGDWRIVVKDNRPLAMAKAVKHEGDQLAGLNLECVVGGRLEYLTIALKLFDPVRSLWINSAGDVQTFKLANGRASGATAVAISKRVLAEEAAFVRQGSGEKWTLEMSIDSDNGPMSEIQMGGFSKMRSYMLANCEN